MADLFPIVWNEFHFLRPFFLWAFIPVFLILVLGLLSIRQEVTWKEMIAPHLRPFVIQKGNERVKVGMHLIGFLVLSLGVLGLAGPTWKKVEVPGQKLETPLVILLDLSQSMLATDLQPNRLERAKFKINDLIKENPQARAALIGFAGTAHTIIPLTRDYDIISSHIDGLSPDVMPFPGSNLADALALADTLMAVTDAPGTVLILSDDIESEEFDLISAFVQNSQNSIQLLPINTTGGAEVPNLSGRGFLKDKDGNTIVSAMNEAVLSQLGSLDRVTVNRLTLDNSDVELISKAVVKSLIFTEKAEEKEDDWRDVGFLLIIPMAVLLLLWFRRGWVLYGVVLLAFTSCSEDQTFEDLWYTKDYQGQKLSDAGDFKAAAERYEDPLRKGVAYYKAGDYEAAIQEFQNDTSAYGAYNLGLAYYKNGDFAAAQGAFQEATELDPTMDQALENQQKMEHLSAGENEVDPEDAKEASPEEAANTVQNNSPEDLSGGGQEATKEDMEQERLAETVNTDVRKGKELDEVPEDISAINQQDNAKVLMRKIDENPSLFLKRKFAYQVKKDSIKPKANERNW
ncbi:VWA domain-containing protein [Algoriphagus halophytocola]|uniref:VWA domain-containing protein n=1 Tax=Algoriphagus halophytocola TaxID=2991499 RepID=UPI0022DDFB70|nr:VWA domain-containing protein [Algoriphagus sp. TR-M9]WBL43054.1 VWA domain-containing protein [Algoriphagus sp. TR-M9]